MQLLIVFCRVSGLTANGSAGHVAAAEGLRRTNQPPTKHPKPTTKTNNHQKQIQTNNQGRNWNKKQTAGDEWSTQEKKRALTYHQ